MQILASRDTRSVHLSDQVALATVMLKAKGYCRSLMFWLTVSHAVF